MRNAAESEENTSAERVTPAMAWVYDRSGRGSARLHSVIAERPLTLYLNGNEVVTLLCAGRHLKELAVGFFHAEGCLNTPDDLMDVQVHEASGKVDVYTRTDSALVERLWSKRTIPRDEAKAPCFTMPSMPS
jgi:FdhD protein